MAVSAKGATDEAKPEVLTLPEILQKYKDRWVAIEVTERDRNSQPTKGRVVGNEVDRYTLGEKTTEYGEVCIFFTGELPFRLLL